MERKQTWTFIDSVVTLVVFVVAVVGRLVVDDVVVVLRADQVVGDRGSGNGKLKSERSAKFLAFRVARMTVIQSRGYIIKKIAGPISEQPRPHKSSSFQLKLCKLRLI